MKSLADLRLKYGADSPTAPPCRRYRLAKAYVQNDVPHAFRDDPPTREMFRYLQQLQRARHAAERRRVRQQNPALTTALGIYRGSPSGLRPLIEAYLLTELNEYSIAKKLGIVSDVVCWFRDAFFDVRHLLGFPARILHQVIRVVDESGRPSLDTHKLWKLAGYMLKSAALDQLLGFVQSGPDGEGGTSAWLTSQTEAIAKLHYLLAVASLGSFNPQQLAAVMKLGAAEQQRRANQDDLPQNIMEKHVQAMLEDIPFSVGVDGERQFEGTIIGEFDKSAPVLRDDELQILAAGGTVSGLKEIAGLTLPPPRRKQPSAASFAPDSLPGTQAQKK